ncbi:MAG TPA: hypothetical protein VKB93_26005 [Thermoanaerobaculia bacterium]|nr:hypothetical protein [Thermoanaerobaculia bacterium]
MKVALVIVALLAAVAALWQYQARRTAKSEEEITRVLQLDPRKVEPSMRALLLLETIPRLRDSRREEAVQRLRGALEMIPRGLILHRPSFPVEAIRFSGDGHSVLWYGRTPAGRFTVEKWSPRAPAVRPWATTGSGATFTDENGTEIFTEDEPAGTNDHIVISSDGRYLSRVQAGFLSIWRVQQVAGGGSGQVYPAYMAEVPYATTRLHCVAAADLCGVEAPGRFTLVDVKGHRVLRSIPVERSATIHLSPAGRLVGVADRRGALTLHGAANGKRVRVDASSLGLEDFAFSADEKSVVIAGRDGVLHSYDTATGNPLGRSAVLRQEQWNAPSRIETVGDGRFVVWSGEKVRLVSADLSTVAARFDGEGAVAVVETNARGNRLAIARRGGALTLWDISEKVFLPLSDAELLASACDHVGRPLTAEEWAAYLPNQKYAPRCH